VDVNDVCSDAAAKLRHEAQDVDTDVDLAALLPRRPGRPHALQQVSSNCLTNARKPSRGRAPARASPCAWFDGQVHLRLADTGPGIPDEIAPSVSPFSPQDRPGTGLGLSIRILDRRGARRAPRARTPGERGRRRSSYVTLPPAPGTARPRGRAGRRGHRGHAATPPLSRAAAAHDPAVDDDPAWRRECRRCSRREGHRVEVAESAQHALELTGTGRTDLILVDARAAGARPPAVGDARAQSALKQRFCAYGLRHHGTERCAASACATCASLSTSRFCGTKRSRVLAPRAGRSSAGL